MFDHHENDEGQNRKIEQGLQEDAVVDGGSTGGFGWKLGELLGVEMVTVPTAVQESNARRALVVVVGALAGVFLLRWG